MISSGVMLHMQQNEIAETVLIAVFRYQLDAQVMAAARLDSIDGEAEAARRRYIVTDTRDGRQFVYGPKGKQTVGTA